jgi:hypothetical protein
MLKLMANIRRFFYIGHILLDVGILGYITSNTYVAYIGLLGSILFLVGAFIAEERIAKGKKTEDTTITN